ncbi:hypothetical protein DFH07DRAFT_205953 [Mycena maculata]|uniref:Uncharacterized protein n=1 Tax=Mycena maculata TaxID=230809 RepID=A0AAD7KF14_9AGAR|nr:hypothetical protein DFH07DRAFT_205953 [Mycena maculata]
MYSATPLEPHTVLTILHYISPTIQLIPQHLVASPLAYRQSCLHLTPDDGPSYLFWPSSNDQHVIDALESLKPIDDDIRLDFQIRYTADDSLFAHVQLTPVLRLLFRWEEGTWKYHNAQLMPFPPDSSASLDDLPDPELADDASSEETPDSYWDSYGETDRDDAAAEREREEPETTGSYWDLYNSVQGSGDSVIPSPAPEKQAHELHTISFSYADMHPATDPMESLSDRLEALSRRRPLLQDEDAITVVDALPTAPDVPGVDALKESLRGVYRLWKTTRSAPSSRDHEVFLSVVHEVLSEP